MTREFGATAWGRAWLRQIEPILIAGDPDRDLVRARSLARRAIDGLCIDGHRVTARLTERGREHVIVLDIPTWTDREHRTASEVLAGVDAAHGGDLPDHLAAALASAGVQIAPPVDDIETTGDADATKRHHVLAVCYALAQRIDEEPVLTLRLRTPPESSPRVETTTPSGLLALTDIDPATFYMAAGST
ncbi:hypothetical protein [Rhodococcus ruber]|uniref:hypothetical protein n=1 Tax=Rhodococcus ruber TaxID=1830 RepID=UPI000C7B6B75|nr:hypothetical protein [Rhodococcus ruber]AUM20109.1 hypothetical protein CSW53_26360 [Rhodococcus ruber]MBD8057308.1 hypothetical protein [Rhodococcus ruber]MCF8786742.1 hypothetical protein [Rhodococcus ruber]